MRTSNAAQRVDYAAHGIIMYVPRNERSRWNAAVTDSARNDLKTAIAAWYGSPALSRDAFRARFWTRPQLTRPSTCSAARPAGWSRGGVTQT